LNLLPNDPWAGEVDIDTIGLVVRGFHVCFTYPLDSKWWNWSTFRARWKKSASKLPGAIDKLQPYFREIAVDASGTRWSLVTENDVDPGLNAVLGPQLNRTIIGIHLLARVPMVRLARTRTIE
jgi:hypothetical protein